jgi:hypothetical protein
MTGSRQAFEIVCWHGLCIQATQLTFVRTMSYRQRIASIREFDGGRTLRWFGVLAVCAAFWLVIVWAGLRFI